MRMYVLFLAAACTKSPATADAEVAPAIDAFVPMDAPGCGQADGWGDISTMAKAAPFVPTTDAMIEGYVCPTTPDYFSITGGGTFMLYLHTYATTSDIVDADGNLVQPSMLHCLPTLGPPHPPLACNNTWTLGSGTYYLRFTSDNTPGPTDPKSYYVNVL